jgi:endonuclease/exonuclease/phosphatase family metal-dependent hydrolase
VAIFYRIDIFTFNDVHTFYINSVPGMITPKVGLVVLLDTIVSTATGAASSAPPPKKRIGVSTIHLSGDPSKPMLPVQEVSLFLNQIGRRYGDVPLIFCGDLNSQPNSLVCSVIQQTGNVPQNFTQPFQLSSAYSDHYGKNPEVTFVTNLIHECVDYIFYRRDSFQLRNAEGLPNYKTVVNQGFLPNDNEGSDHLPLIATFALK